MGGVFKLPHGRLYVNRGKAPEIFYDSNQEPIILQPGEARFEQILNKFDLGKFFLSPELWNAQKATEEVIATKGSLKVLVKRTVHGIGDQIIITTIPKAYCEVFGKKVIVDVYTAESYVDVWQENPYIRRVWTEKPGEEYDVILDVNNVELRAEPREWEDEWNRKNRTSIFLEQLGVYLVNRVPVYVVSEKERLWAMKQLKGVKRPQVGLQYYSSVKSRTYPHMSEVGRILKKRGYGTIVLDAKRGNGRFKYTFRQAAALASVCDVIVAPDSALLHVAGALRKRIVGVFGYTDGKIFTQDYE